MSAVWLRIDVVHIFVECMSAVRLERTSLHTVVHHFEVMELWLAARCVGVSMPKIVV